MNTKTAYILIGLPGSGKTYLRNKYIESGKATYYLNKDELREKNPTLNEKHIHQLFLDQLQVMCDSEKNLVLDNTHLNRRTVNQFRAVLERNGYTVEEKELEIPLYKCVLRDQIRRANGERYVGQSVILRMAMDYGKYEHLGITMNFAGEDATLWDLDGTICDIQHRRHYVQNTPKNWKKFFAGIRDDKVNKAVASIYHANKNTKILVSGRGEEYRRETELWLEENGFIDYYILLMRNKGDHRDDTIVKREIHDKYIKPYFNVQWIVDDRKRVVDMWRSLGYTVFHCDEGDF